MTKLLNMLNNSEQMIKRKSREMNVNVNLHSLNTTDAESIMPNLRRYFSKWNNYFVQQLPFNIITSKICNLFTKL